MKIYTREETMNVSTGLGDIVVEDYAAEVSDELGEYVCRTSPHRYSETPFQGTPPAKRSRAKKNENTEEEGS